mgnify:FL=1
MAVKMDEGQLLAALENAEGLADRSGDLGADRSRNLDFYHGKPLGNEVEGRSVAISRDVFEVVEGVKPSLLRIFAGGDEVVRFEPRGPEDEAQAKQETDYINYVCTEKNNWFLVASGWFHDALVQKVGYVKAYHDESDDLTKETYRNLSDDEFALLGQSLGDEAKSIAHEAQEIIAPDMIRTVHHVQIERTKKTGQVRICNLAPESVRVSHTATSVSTQDLDFIEHREYKTISELRLAGFDVADDLSDSGSDGQDWEAETRDQYSILRQSEGDESDPSMRRVLVREAWMRVDFDGDGKAELRHVVVVGDTFLVNEEADFIPIAAITPVILPHQHTGLCPADAVLDIQIINTLLLRGGLDNLYLRNNGRYAVDQARVNLDDMLVSRPGGIVRTSGDPQSAIFPLQHPTNAADALQMMEMMAASRETRTGITRYNQGLDADSLNKTATGVSNIMQAAQQRIELIARTFAETGVKDLFRIVHAITLKHARQQEIVRIRNEWTPVDPRSWVKRQDLSTSVGLGTGMKEQQAMMLLQIIGNAAAMGVTTPDRVYNAFKRAFQALGYKNAEEFLADPSKQPPQQPPPDPKVELEKAKLQFEQQKTQMEMQAEAQRSQMQMQLEQQQAAARAQFDQWKAQMEAQTQMEIARMRAEMEQQTKIEIARINAHAKVISGPREPSTQG